MVRLSFVFLLAVASGAAKPNVLLIVADDLGWNDVGYHGSEIKTPNIDSLVSQGVELDRYYAFPLCSPTRAALMSGRSPLRWGILGPLTPQVTGGVPLDERLVPEIFRDGGYQTFMAGKWHLGHSHVDYFPHNRGFDSFYGHLGGTLNYYLHTHRRVLDWQRNGKSLEEEGYSTHLIADEAIRNIQKRDKSKPFLMYVAFNAPHGPLQAPDSSIEKYAHIEDKYRRIFAAMVDELDAAIGRLLETIADEGIRDETLVVFVSDNGGEQRIGGSNAPLPGNKGETREGGIRVPAAVYWPGVATGPRLLNQMVTAHDWLPTLAAATGIETGVDRPLDGHDMWPAIQAGEAVARRPTVIGGGTGPNPWLTVFSGDWKLLRVPAQRGEPSRDRLYRILADPLEENDLAAENVQTARRLGRFLDDFEMAPRIGGATPQRGATKRATKKGGGGGPAAMPDDTLPQAPGYAERAARD